MRDEYPGYKKYILEIGSGWGEFAIESAKEQSSQIIFALEKKKKRVLRAARNQEKENIQNIRWMIVDVHWFFEEIFSSNSFDKVIINFPDPWPKKRHRKHRFMNNDLIQSITKITHEKAELEFVSDDWSYVEEALRTLENARGWSNRHGQGVVLKEMPTRKLSFYEELQKKDGRNVYYLDFKKTNKNLSF